MPLFGRGADGAGAVLAHHASPSLHQLRSGVHVPHRCTYALPYALAYSPHAQPFAHSYTFADVWAGPHSKGALGPGRHAQPYTVADVWAGPHSKGADRG